MTPSPPSVVVSSTPPPPPPQPLVTVRIRPTGPHCPMGLPIGPEEIAFSILPGGCIWLNGPSGRGKTTIAQSLVPALQQQSRVIHSKLQLQVVCEWYPSVQQTSVPPVPPSVGILFQQTTLIDELTVAGNLALAIQCHQNQRNKSHYNKNNDNNNNTTTTTTNTRSLQQQMKSVMEMVGLNYANDIEKRCYELSGGMARRVSLAMQLLQQKQILVLDEPFTGLDRPTAQALAYELVRLRRQQPYQMALVLITHEPELAHIVLNETTTATTTTTPTTTTATTNHHNTIQNVTVGNVIVSLPEPQRPAVMGKDVMPSQHPPHINTTGIYMYDRFVHKLYDYIIYSIPLIVGTFIATGMAISMITADALQRLHIQEPIQQLIDTEIRPLITMITGESSVNPLYMLGIKMKVNQMLQSTIPTAKMNIYTIGMIQLFVLEIGPLLTGLLLAGRIGGSYAGNIVTMMTTSQLHLLQTMGISTNVWLLYPTLCAAWWAGPILTLLGTSTALFLTSYVGVRYQLLSSMYDFWLQVQTTIFPTLRLQGIVVSRQNQPEEVQLEQLIDSTAANIKSIFELDYYRTTYSPNSWYETMIEIVTYPILFAITKSIVFITIIICAAELCTRYYNHYNYYYHHHHQSNHSKYGTGYRQHHTLTHRDVPHVITTSVVLASLGIIIADWGFSRLWLQRH